MMNEHGKRVVWGVVLGVLGSLGMLDRFEGPSTDGQVHAAGYDRPVGNPHQSRSAVVAEHGIVATSHPLAAQVGLEVLKDGGTAADAAIATNAMLGLVEPMSCGIGGDLFVIYWDADSQKLYGLNASGRSPYKLTREVFEKKGLSQIPTEGPLAWSVPGCVDGWAELSERFGRLPFKRLLQPAIQYGEEGFPVSEIIAGYWRGAVDELKKWPDSAETYLPDGRAPKAGEIFKNPNLARTYRLIAEGGRDAFYEGPIAEEIVAFSEANGGYFSLKDFADHTSTWVEPVSTTYRGHRVWELPPNGQGIAALQILNLLEPYDIAAMGHNSADFIHLYTEAKKLAFADRATYYADPEFADVPREELISKEYADRRRKLIDESRASVQVEPGDPQLVHGDTVYLTVVDKDRNCCSFIQSIYYGFGSKVVPGDLGFALQNRGALFALDEEHRNRLEPHKRPFHTIIPAMVTKGGKPTPPSPPSQGGEKGGVGKPWLCFGVMGGAMQPQGHTQVLVNIIDHGMNVQEAGDAARVRHFGSQTPTGEPMDETGGEIRVESGVSDAVIEELRRRGHRVERGRGGFGGYQGILIDWENGTLQGGSDPRKDGCAVGY